MRRVVPIALLLTLTVALSAQRLPTELLCRWTGAHRLPVPNAISTPLGPTLSLLRFEDSLVAARTYDHLRFHPALVTVQYNYWVTFRTLPNDPRFPRQPNLSRMRFDAAWTVTTGGALSDGTPIVTAILDDGFDTDHVDLRDNLWLNRGEVPGDGIDNDGNGYVDDLHGWNFVDGLGEYPATEHGTQVAGILGATGNNGTGIAGTNWRAQIMLFAIRTVADIVAAYEYVYDQRLLFDRSGGERGAFVVASNASFGVAGATCADFPLWAEQYERLEELGITTAVSVVNAPRDVDTDGDMPADCPSAALLSVTNIGLDGELHEGAGYGSRTVDLGAMGQGSYGTRPADRYGNFGSTSAAAPYVTGAVSLLYATPCPSLQQLIRSAPGRAAARIRTGLLATVRPNPTLSGRTVSGGTLDVAAAQAWLLENCLEQPQALAVTVVYPQPATDRVTVLTNQLQLSSGVTLALYDLLGRRQPTPPYQLLFDGGAAGLTVNLGGLTAGTYIIQLRDETGLAAAVIQLR